MSTVIFEITNEKTVVVIGEERTDITDTNVEKHFIKALKELHKHRLAQQMLDAIDIDKFSPMKP